MQILFLTVWYQIQTYDLINLLLRATRQRWEFLTIDVYHHLTRWFDLLNVCLLPLSRRPVIIEHIYHQKTGSLSSMPVYWMCFMITLSSDNLSKTDFLCPWTVTKSSTTSTKLYLSVLSLRIWSSLKLWDYSVVVSVLTL